MTPWGDEADLRKWLVDYLLTNVGSSPAQIDLDAPLNELGLGSRDTVVLARELSEMLGRPVSPVDFWENPTINTLAHGLLNPDAEPALVVGGRASLEEPIAVIGLGCRLPSDIHDPEAFWQLLAEGRSTVGRVPDERWQVFDDGSAEVGAALARTTRWGSFLDDVVGFDAEYFDISPGEADRMDPQQRLLLEVAVEALDHAGIAPESLRRTQTGVFAGASVSEYSFLLSRDVDRIDAWTSTGGALSIIANRLSYFLDLRGPSLTVDTACSSSLVAIHLACNSLRTAESDLALAAGVNLVLSPVVTRSLDAAGAMSQSGACRAFDAGADGFVRGEGCGVVVLKRLSEALRDANRVLAVVRGSAINQDGRSNGLMAPNPAAQAAVLRAACAAAGVDPREVDYVETHGTGTPLGDPIEARGLGSVYGRDRAPDSPLLIGSVKTNVGHLEAAAGVTGFIKATLAVLRGRIPANLHFDTPNPHIPFEELGLRVVDEPTNWPSTGRPRRAALSSFGFGGTNAHLVLEQPPAPASPHLHPAVVPVTTLVVAGKTPQRVARWAGVLADWMDGTGAVVPLADIAHTVNHHRNRHGSFATVAARTRKQAVAGLRALAAGQSAPGVVEPHHVPCSPGVVFVYSGQGSQWAGMGQQLLADEPAFADAVDELEPEFVAQAGFSLKQILAGGEPLVGIDRIQPVLVAVQLALTGLWRSYGIRPDAVIGHSMGEVTAAVVSGALSVADGLRVIATRSQLMARMSGRGAMAMVELGPQAAEDLIGGDEELTVAVYASPRQTVIAGPPAKIDAVIAELQATDRLARLVDVDVASHHPAIDPILPGLRAELADLMPRFLTIPVISTTSGRQFTPAFDADYWADNLRNPVRFSHAITEAAERHGIFIEVSPHPLLTHAITDTLVDTHHHSVGTLQRDAHDTHTFHTNLNAAHTTHPPQTPHLPEPHPLLPSAPWLHADHWISTTPRPAATRDPRRFVHQFAWTTRPVDQMIAPPVAASIAIVGPDEDANARVRELLSEHGHHAATPTDANYVMYMAGDEPVVGSGSDLDAAVRICDEVTTLVRQLTDRHDQHPAKLWVLTHGVLEAVGSSALPQSCLWGLAGVIAVEQPKVWGGLVDLPAAAEPEEWLAVVAEQLSTPSKSVLVLRDGEVRAPELVPVDGQPVRPALRCRPDVAYLIIGGLGALGLLTANWLADRGARRLVLAGRTALPPRRQWENVTDPVTADRTAAIRSLEARGVAVDAVALDVAAPGAVQALLDRRDAVGAPPIRGLIHAAGVTRNQLLTGLNVDALREVMSPKVAGARALDTAFPPESVDFFFLISSAAAVSGLPGQGSYAAANAYLDTLARSRHRRGGHTLSIDWVAWRDLGFAADVPLVVAELERLGSRPVEPDEAFEAWQHIAAYDVAQAVVIPVADGEQPNAVVERPASAPPRDWSKLPAAEVYRELSDGLIAILARELRLGEDELQVDVPFAELGLNSLLAMSIRRQAELLMGVELSVTILWDHPTVAALAAYLTDKVTRQADGVFDALSVGRSAPRIGGVPSRLAPLVVMPRPERVPLSFAQSRLWFLDRFEGGVATYNLPTALRIYGPLDPQALDAALDDVIARHESLRTIFPDIDGVPFQEVLPARAGMWRRGGEAVISLAEQEVAGALVELAGYRFDLSSEIPIRAQIYSVGPEQYAMGIVLHHIAFDGWSIAPMVRDVGEAYRARRQGRAPQWAPLPVQYADYTLWQQDWLGVESDPESVIAEQLAYWRQELADLPEVVSLPTDRARPPAPSYRGDGVEVRIDPQMWAGVKQLAAAHNATASMVLQAVMAVLLHRVGVGEDVVMGTPIAGRLDQALDDLVGFFVNTWVLRVSVNAAQRFSEVLERVRQKALDAYSNQDVPFELLVEQLNPVRSTAHHPLFQVAVAFQNTVRPEVALDGVSVEPMGVGIRTAKFDLDLDLREVPTEDPAAPMAAGVVSYATDLFDRASIERLVTWFGRVLEAVVADASVVVGEVSLLDRGERDLLLSAWSGAGVGAPVGVAPQLLAAAVATDPDAVAVIDGARVVSYRELDEWSTRLARVLIEAGVGPDRAVGVAMDRCVELVAAWWAVVKAGGVCVPVDRAHPVERIATVLDAVGAVCVVTCGADTVTGAGARPVVSIDGVDLSRRCAEAITDAERLAPLGVDDAAYVIFTSGSTGAPKGVAVSHAGLLGLAAAQREVFGLGPDARVLMVASPTFDASVFELTLAVGSAAAVVVAQPDAFAGEALTTLLHDQRVSAAVLTPTVLSSLDPDWLDGLDTLITAGEACPEELVAAWAPGRRMFNAYGPTETTIWATCSAPLSAGQPVSIGAPIPGACALVLDARLHPAPIGVVSELYLSGPALARGYLGRAELTAERFVANPYGPPGARMYRTGDLVRWRPDGTLDYLGRADTQIKLRGQRIELGEIENTLLACPHVAQAGAGVHHSDIGTDHLVAYVTFEHTSTADQDAEIVEQWQHAYDELYDSEVAVSEFGMDFRGWNSSYTDDPIPREQMAEWRWATVDRILALRPRRVLEIGVGSGLVLSQIAPECAEYWGTDFSAPTIQTLQAAVAAQAWGDRVQVRVQPADMADGLPQGHFDVVVLNSIIQYFPSLGYLTEVLAVAMRLLAPGGALFIGDVRNHTLQGAFQTAVALARTDTTDTDAAEIRQRVQRAMLCESELLLAPEFFTSWAAEHPSVAGLDIQVKRGSADNELNRYRYDVTIHKTPTPVRSLATTPTWAWTQCAGLRGLHDQLISQRPAAARITEIPRSGLITDVHIEQAIAAGQPVADALAQATDTATPEQLHRLGETSGYHVAVTWGAQPGTLDAVFVTPADPRPLTDLYLPPIGAYQVITHANDPHTNTKISAVRQRVSERLPDYMVPAQIVVLDEFPLTSSGKIDRNALPPPLFDAKPFRAPQTQTEKTVAGVFAEVLGVDRVGVDDSFFDLGGDSLSAMRVIAAINTSLDTQLPVRTLFEAPSVSGLSQRLRRPASPVEIAPVETLKHGTGVPLFCFHPAGGLAWPYQPLGNYLDCPIIGIQQASGEDSEPESIRGMATRYADRLQAVHRIGPYNLLGWSLGGVIAHEVAIELHRRGCVVRRLILLDAAPWGDINLTQEQVSGTVVQSYVLELMLGYLRIDIPEQSEPLTYQQAEELIHHQIPLPIAQLRVFLKFFVRNMKASFRYLSEHVPGVFDGDMVVFSTIQNGYDYNLPLHWRPYVTGDITEHPVDCPHLEMLSPESIKIYGKQLRNLLET